MTLPSSVPAKQAGLSPVFPVISLSSLPQAQALTPAAARSGKACGGVTGSQGEIHSG